MRRRWGRGSLTTDTPLRADYLVWRDSIKGLGGVARLMQDRPFGRAEVEDLHARLGELLGIGGRGGVTTRERWVRCKEKKAASCPTCQASRGHGPYLMMKINKKWVQVEEEPAQRKERRVRALAELHQVEVQHALQVLENIQAEAVEDGLLRGADADAARGFVAKRVL